MLDFKEYRRTIAPKEFCNRVEAKKLYRDYIRMFKEGCTTQGLTMKDFNKAKKALQKANVPMTQCFIAQPNTFEFSDCEPIAPTSVPQWCGYAKEQQESNLMAYETKTTAAVASIINAASDESKQRDFLLDELRRFAPYDWRTPFDDTLRELFNTDAPKAPKTSQELLDAFKAGAFTVDQKKVDMNTAYLNDDGMCEDGDGEYVGRQYYGITFTTLPIEDSKGYTKAKEEFKAALKDAKRTIMIGTPTEGLAALKALESWKTTVVPATTPVAPTPVAA